MKRDTRTREKFKKKAYWNRFMTHVTKTLENSTIAGIPQIVSANNSFRKLIRAAVFFSCLFGFCYQFWTFMELYWAYPIVLDVQVKSPSVITIPSFTICDHNGYTLKSYCSVAKHECVPVKNETEFCIMKRRYCHRRKLPEGFRIPENESRLIYETMNEREMDEIPYIPQDYNIKMCEMLTAGDTLPASCRKARRAPYTKGDIEIRTNCLMFNSIWKLPDAEVDKIPSTAVINLLLLTNKTDYFPFIDDQFIAMYIDFHSPTALANPFLNGFVMYPGMRYKYYIKETELALKGGNLTQYFFAFKVVISELKLACRKELSQQPHFS
ncbi:uncharacterized protein NPIL_509501 [Nephila pilipes]|uniref:Uncharacterized protein n=1 Tax=Nephila pilipes TaxID=299642 RepID=A0A8X6TB01_NEPPI|nr:uncharacterized protein NPIL_509501 [Nephila pilipes]